MSGHDLSRAVQAPKKIGALAPEDTSRVPPVPTLRPGKEKIVFHDPCYLGRYRGVYDQPRQIAALAGELVEAPRSRERSFCCGAGGGLAFLGEEKGERVSQGRAAELASTGASVVAAACPFCNTMFRDALASQVSESRPGAPTPKLLDIAQIAARRLPEER